MRCMKRAQGVAASARSCSWLTGFPSSWEINAAQDYVRACASYLAESLFVADDDI